MVRKEAMVRKEGRKERKKEEKKERKVVACSDRENDDPSSDSN